MKQAPSLLDSAADSTPGRSYIQDVFGALGRERIDYALLRGCVALVAAPGTQEIDVLVAPRQLSRLTDVLIQRGFATLPAWGHAPHHFFMAYDSDTDTWWKLDVVTDLRYGPNRAIQVGDVESWLRRSSPNHLLSPEDEFISLLLHGLLDRSAFKPEHQARLAVLRSHFEKHQKAGRRAVYAVERWLAPSLTWNTVNRAIETQDWDLLIQHRSALFRQLLWRDPLMTSGRYLSGVSLRFIRPVLIAFRSRGWTVALVGPDGAGKSTLARALTEERPLRARQIYMGINRDAVNTGLAGTRWMERHREPLRKSAQSRAKSSLSGLAIVNRLVDQWYRLAVACFHRMRGRLVIFDRYVYDPRTGGRTLMAGRNLRQRWLRATAPIPDLVVLLDAPAQVLHQRKGEHTPDRLERMRSAYLGLREEFPQTIVVDATQDADTVKKTVIALIWRRMSGRSSSLHNSS